MVEEEQGLGLVCRILPRQVRQHHVLASGSRTD